ncbi:hypothetical protein ACFL1R_01085, partial [Candidatus Latescibacterota bacterium]
PFFTIYVSIISSAFFCKDSVSCPVNTNGTRNRRNEDIIMFNFMHRYLKKTIKTLFHWLEIKFAVSLN